MPPKRIRAEVPRFCLLRWLEDDTVSVVREDSTKKGMTVHVVAYADFKWSGSFYEAEVLKISSKRWFSYISVQLFF